MYALAAIGSVTTAAKLKNEAARVSGVKAAVVHTPSEINKGGCSYSLRFKEEYIPIIRSSAERARINIKGIYIEVYTGKERVYHAVP